MFTFSHKIREALARLGGQVSLYRTPVMVLAIGLPLSVVTFAMIHSYEREMVGTHFAHLARDAHHAIERELGRDAETVAAVGHLFEASGTVTAGRFGRFTGEALADHRDVQALEWVPRVPVAERQAFERRARADGLADYRIKTLGEGAPPTKAYYPVRYLEPLAGNEPALGLDLGSEPVRRAVLEAARRNGRVRMSGPITLIQERGGSPGYLLTYPVTVPEVGRAAPGSGPPELLGFAVGVFRVVDLVGTALHPEQEQRFDLVLHDVTGAGARLLYPAPDATRGPPDAKGATPFRWVGRIDVFGRTWQLEAVATPAFVTAHRRIDAWLGFAVVVLATLGVAAFLFAERRRRYTVGRAHREWQDAFDTVPDPIFLHDRAGRVMRANRAYALHAGMGLPDVIGRPYWEVFPVSDGPTDACMAARSEDGAAEETVTSTGRTYHARYFPVQDEEGYYRYWVHLLEDITERLQAEAERRAEQERARSYLDIASVIILALDTEGRITMINRAGCELLGYAEAELLGADWFETALPPDWRDRVGEVFRNNVGGDTHHHVENPVLTRSGEERTIAWQNAPIRGPGGEITGTLSSGLDITERREWEQRLKASEERLQLALEGARDGLWDWDVKNDRVYYSPRWKQLLGYTDTEIGEGFEEWRSRVHPGDLEAAEAAVRSALEDGGEYLSNEFRMRHKDGRWVWILARATLIRDDAGRPVRMVGTHVDMTDIREAQRRESEARAALQERVKELRCMYGVAELVFDLERPMEDILGDVARLLPRGWNSPEETCARVRWRDREFLSAGFAESEWRQSAEWHLNGETAGQVEVFLHGAPADARDPFLPEEYALIDRVAQELGNAEELREKEVSLRRANRVLMTLSESNRSLVRAADERQLTQGMCNVLVANGDYALAWVGFRDPADQEALRQVALATAADVGAMGAVDVSPVTEGPLVARAMESGRRQYAGPDEESAYLAQGQESTACRASVALPLAVEDVPFGALAVCSADPFGMDQQELDLFEELADDVAYGVRALRIRTERDRAVSAYDQLLFQTIEAIALTVEKRDPYTAGHQKRVADLAAEIAVELGWTEEQVRGLRLGATIHDLGKVYIPAEILNRPGRLTVQEFSLIQTHPDVGYEIVHGVDFPWPVAEMIRQHHERLDGSGYPRGLAGEEIVPEARVMAVADVVEAVVAHRPYRPGRGLDKALAVIRDGRGTLFDPEVVDVCTRLFEEGRFTWAEPS